MSIKQDQELVTELCDIEKGLNEWEVEFVDGIGRQVLDRKHALSDYQIAVAVKIRDRFRRRAEADE